MMFATRVSPSSLSILPKKERRKRGKATRESEHKLPEVPLVKPMYFEREPVLIASLFSIALGLFVWWWLWVLRPLLDKIEARVDVLDKAMVHLKLNMEGIADLLDRLRTANASRTEARATLRRNEYCDLVKRHNLLLEKHGQLTHTISCLPPVVGERYSTVWDGVTDMFDRMLKAKYEVVEE
jgi:hypothetical protein